MGKGRSGIPSQQRGRGGRGTGAPHFCMSFIRQNTKAPQTVTARRRSENQEIDGIQHHEEKCQLEICRCLSKSTASVQTVNAEVGNLYFRLWCSKSYSSIPVCTFALIGDRDPLNEGHAVRTLTRSVPMMEEKDHHTQHERRNYVSQKAGVSVHPLRPDYGATRQ